MADLPEIAVSSWALHDLLGRPGKVTPQQDAAPTPAETPRFTVLQLCGELGRHGIRRLELCHFHIADTQPAALQALREAVATEAATLSSLLIDAGDVGDAAKYETDVPWLEGWIGRAAALGCGACRISAGRQPPTAEVTPQVIRAFERLVQRAESLEIRLVTENWLDYTDVPRTVHGLLDRFDGRLGLCLDFKNWLGRFEDIASLAPRAESCHVPAVVRPGSDEPDPVALRCLEILRDVGFTGVYTLVEADPADPWGSLARSAEVIAAVTGAVRHPVAS